MTARGRDRLLRVLQVVSYIGFVFLWFKDNIQPLKKIPTSFWVPLVPLLLVTAVRLYIRIKRTGIRLPRVPKKVLWAVLALSLIALTVRVPFLLHSHGLVTSDDATPALAAKHIVEGKVPPICYYGYLYVGSLISHIAALAFWIFGYSILGFKLITFLLYLAFILVHFFILKEIFSQSFAFLVSLVYCLPIGELIIVGFDDTLAMPLVLLIGGLIVFLARRITEAGRETLIPALGLLMGIGFWTHQMLVYFILLALIMLFVKYRWDWKKYLIVAVYGLIGFLPQLMQEFYVHFHLASFLAAGQRVLNWIKIKNTLELLNSLVALGGGPTKVLFLVLMLVGFAALIVLSVRRRKFFPYNIYTLFTLIFFVLYFASGHSNRPLARYLCPLWFVMPVLMLAGFLLIKPRIKYAGAAALILVLLLGYNIKNNITLWRAVRDVHHERLTLVTALEGTGRRFWRAPFWTAYQVTALAAEKVIVASSTALCYYPYNLYYYNQNPSENFILKKEPSDSGLPGPENFIATLKVLGVNFKSLELKDYYLAYNIPRPAFAQTQYDPIPPRLPRLDAPRISAAEGELRLVFKNPCPGEDLPYRVNVEVGDYSSVWKRIHPADAQIEVRLPYPPDVSFPVRYFLDYQGIKIPSTIDETTFTLPAGTAPPKSEDVVLLGGFGPVVKVEETMMRICQKEVKFRWISRPGGRNRLRLNLYSPFGFSQIYWYGDYAQEVEILGERRLLKTVPLQDGKNAVELDLDGLAPPGHEVVVALKFKYHLPFDFAPLWRTAALLQKIEVE